MHFAFVDWLLIGIFCLAVSVIGLASRLRIGTPLQFLTAGRNLTLPIFVATLVTTWYGGILGIGESVSYFGVGTWLLLGVPYYVFGTIYAFKMAGRVRDGEAITLPERLAGVWGRQVGLLSAGLVFLLAVPAAQVYMVGILIQTVTGYSLPICISVAAVAGCLFLMRGGMWADARMGALAFLLMYGGFVAMNIVAWHHVSLFHAISQLKEPGLRQLDGGQGPLAVLSFFILGAWTLVDPAFHQRVASAANSKVGKNGVLVSVVCWIVFDILSISAGLFAIVGLKHMPNNPVAIFPAFADEVLPPGVKGLFFIGMFGTVLSALVGYTLVSGVTVGREFVGRLWPSLSDAQVTAWSRAGLFIGAATAVGVALFVNSVVELWYAWAGALVGALLIPVAVSYRRSSANPFSSSDVLWSMSLSFLAALAWLGYGKRTNNSNLTVYWLGESFSLGTLVPALALSAIILSGNVIARKWRARSL